MATRFWRALPAVVLILLAGCASHRPSGNLIEVSTSAPGASTVEILVATTREQVSEPAGVVFGGERTRGIKFADIAISIPPDADRKAGEIQWPQTLPGDPAHDFVTRHLEVVDLAKAKAEFDDRIAQSGSKQVLVFVHGYNTRFEEAVYRFAQIVHDSHADVVPVLFTWPSRGHALAYFYDRESANYSRDALETVLQTIVDDKKVAKVSVLAHSLGNFVAVEALRQMAIRDKGLPHKITDIMLASPDIDVDVFRSQIAEIETDDKAPPITIFVSQDDKALGLSKMIAGNEPRLGAIDPTKEPYRSLLEDARVHLVDLTKVAGDDKLNHGKFSTSEVVASIGDQLATGQPISGGSTTFGESIGAMAIQAADATAEATAPDDGRPGPAADADANKDKAPSR